MHGPQEKVERERGSHIMSRFSLAELLTAQGRRWGWGVLSQGRRTWAFHPAGTVSRCGTRLQVCLGQEVRSPVFRDLTPSAALKGRKDHFQNVSFRATASWSPVPKGFRSRRGVPLTRSPELSWVSRLVATCWQMNHRRQTERERGASCLNTKPWGKRHEWWKNLLSQKWGRKQDLSSTCQGSGQWDQERVCSCDFKRGGLFSVYSIGIQNFCKLYSIKGYCKIVDILPCEWVTHSVVSYSLWPRGPPGSSHHGIFQARILEWVAFPFSRGSSQPKD